MKMGSLKTPNSALKALLTFEAQLNSEGSWFAANLKLIEKILNFFKWGDNFWTLLLTRVQSIMWAKGMWINKIKIRFHVL